MPPNHCCSFTASLAHAMLKPGNYIIKRNCVLVSSRSTGRDLLDYGGLQRFSLSVQKSPTVQTLRVEGHENSRPIEESSIPRGFFCEDSSVLIIWVISYQIEYPRGLDAAPVCLQMATSYVTRSQSFVLSIPRPANIIKHAEGWRRTDGLEATVVCSLHFV